MSDFQMIVTQLSASLLVLWVVLIGAAFVVQRRDWAAAVARWPFIGAARATWWILRQTVWLLRRAIGGLFVALGNWIRG